MREAKRHLSYFSDDDLIQRNHRGCFGPPMVASTDLGHRISRIHLTFCHSMSARMGAVRSVPGCRRLLIVVHRAGMRARTLRRVMMRTLRIAVLGSAKAEGTVAMGAGRILPVPHHKRRNRCIL